MRLFVKKRMLLFGRKSEGNFTSAVSATAAAATTTTSYSLTPVAETFTCACIATKTSLE